MKLLSRIRATSPSLLTVLFAAACGAPAAVERDAGDPVVDAHEPDGALSPDAAPSAPDAAPPPPPTFRPQAGGDTAAIAIAEGRAYVGVGPRLTIWDLDGPTPTLVGETDPLSGVVSGIAIDDGHAFVTSMSYADGALHVIDVGDPQDPTPLAELRVGAGATSRPSTVVAVEDAVFVGDGEQGVFRVDVSTPTAPVVTAWRPTLSPLQVQVLGDRLNVLEWSTFGLAVEAFSTADLTPIGGSFLDGADAGTLTAGGLLVSRVSAGLAVDDVSDPTELQRRFTSTATPSAMVAGDGGAWVTIGGYLRFLDLSDPDAITLGPASPAVSWAASTGAFAGDTLALVTYQGELEVVDVASTTSPVVTARIVTGTSPTASAAAGDTLVVTEAAPNIVSAIDVLDADDLTITGRNVQGSAAFQDVAYADDHGYVLDAYSGFWVFDLSDASQPRPLEKIATGAYPTAIATGGDHVYLSDVTNGGTLRVFSLAGGSGPEQLGAIATHGLVELVGRGDLVFAAAVNGALRGGLTIFDTASPAEIELAGYDDDCASASGVAVDGTLALLACADTLHVIDVSDVSAPVTVGQWQLATPDYRALAISGERAYVGHAHGVSVLDLSNPQTPVLVDELPTAWPVHHLLIAGDRLVASTTRGGLYQWPHQGVP